MRFADQLQRLLEKEETEKYIVTQSPLRFGNKKNRQPENHYQDEDNPVDGATKIIHSDGIADRDLLEGIIVFYFKTLKYFLIYCKKDSIYWERLHFTLSLTLSESGQNRQQY